MVAWIDSASPSAQKPGAVMTSWLVRFLGQIEAIQPDPVTVEQLSLAHDRSYVEGILSCQLRNGFHNSSPDIARSLPYTTGAMLAAAREAIRNGKVAVAPCSGFHHAGWARAEGYCTFNGLIVSALVLKQEGLVNRVGILDYDQHVGNGTQELINRLGLDWVRHISAATEYCYASQAEDFLAAIPDMTQSMSDCDVILYQAGADPHIRDPLGGWLTTDQLRSRDRLVFESCASLEVPIAWNLAGGYQQPLHRVLEIHDNTMRECIAVYGDCCSRV
jgi:acetoin utilization deacetylase AcuC-like enzyme